MADKKGKSRGLGRGLSALMADIPAASETGSVSSRPADQMVPIEKIEPNRDQPRRSFDQEALSELSESIRHKGIIQPLIVRPYGDGYQIVAGERRWRAAQRAQLHEVPVIIRDFSDTEVFEVAIIENIQRADLNPVEEASGYKLLMDRFGHTQEKLAEAMGKSRSHIANLMRLLTLPEDVQTMVETGALSAGHARALITAEDPSALARIVVQKGLSVRETEKLVKKHPEEPKSPAPARPAQAKDADTLALEGDLSAALGMKVHIDHKAGGEAGSVVIRYNSLDDLDTLVRLLGNS